MSNPAPGFAKHPSHQVEIDPIQTPVTVSWSGHEIAKASEALQVRESRYDAVLYLPLSAMQAAMDSGLLTPTTTESYCPFKGHASYWTLASGEAQVKDVLWSYKSPYDECLALQGYGAFYADKVTIEVG